MKRGCGICRFGEKTSSADGGGLVWSWTSDGGESVIITCRTPAGFGDRSLSNLLSLLGRVEFSSAEKYFEVVFDTFPDVERDWEVEEFGICRI